MNLLQILSKYKKEDAEQMEREKKVNLSPSELWELEKLKDEPRTYETFKRDLNKTIDLEK